MYNHPDLIALLVASRRQDFEEQAARVRARRRRREGEASPQRRTVDVAAPIRPRRVPLLALVRRRPGPASAA